MQSCKLKPNPSDERAGDKVWESRKADTERWKGPEPGKRKGIDRKDNNRPATSHVYISSEKGKRQTGKEGEKKGALRGRRVPKDRGGEEKSRTPFKKEGVGKKIWIYPLM